MDCTHSLADRETSCADGMCPDCLQAKIEAALAVAPKHHEPCCICVDLMGEALRGEP